MNFLSRRLYLAAAFKRGGKLIKANRYHMSQFHRSLFWSPCLYIFLVHMQSSRLLVYATAPSNRLFLISACEYLWRSSAYGFYRATLYKRGIRCGPVSFCHSVHLSVASRCSKRIITQTRPNDILGVQFSAAEDLSRGSMLK